MISRALEGNGNPYFTERLPGFLFGHSPLTKSWVDVAAFWQAEQLRQSLIVEREPERLYPVG